MRLGPGTINEVVQWLQRFRRIYPVAVGLNSAIDCAIMVQGVTVWWCKPNSSCQSCCSCLSCLQQVATCYDSAIAGVTSRAMIGDYSEAGSEEGKH